MVEERVVDAGDASLLEAWCAGDVHAAKVLVERHFDGLYRFFRSKIAGDVDDLVQQTFFGSSRMRRCGLDVERSGRLQVANGARCVGQLEHQPCWALRREAIERALVQLER